MDSTKINVFLRYLASTWEISIGLITGRIIVWEPSSTYSVKISLVRRSVTFDISGNFERFLWMSHSLESILDWDVHKISSILLQ